MRGDDSVPEGRNSCNRGLQPMEESSYPTPIALAAFPPAPPLGAREERRIRRYYYFVVFLFRGLKPTARNIELLRSSMRATRPRTGLNHVQLQERFASALVAPRFIWGTRQTSPSITPLPLRSPPLTGQRAEGEFRVKYLFVDLVPTPKGVGYDIYFGLFLTAKAMRNKRLKAL